MNKKQLEIIAKRLRLPADRVQAARAVLFDSVTDRDAERSAHATINTVRRDILRIKSLYNLHKELDNAR